MYFLCSGAFLHAALPAAATPNAPAGRGERAGCCCEELSVPGWRTSAAEAAAATLRRAQNAEQEKLGAIPDALQGCPRKHRVTHGNMPPPVPPLAQQKSHCELVSHISQSGGKPVSSTGLFPGFLPSLSSWVMILILWRKAGKRSSLLGWSEGGIWLSASGETPAP